MKDNPAPRIDQLYRQYFEKIRPALAEFATAIYEITISEHDINAFWVTLRERNQLSFFHRGIITAAELVNVVLFHLQNWIEQNFQVKPCETAEQLQRGEPSIQKIAKRLHSFATVHHLATPEWRDWTTSVQHRD